MLKLPTESLEALWPSSLELMLLVAEEVSEICLNQSGLPISRRSRFMLLCNNHHTPIVKSVNGIATAKYTHTFAVDNVLATRFIPTKARHSWD
jgi:hypothetical protein